jgi:hypothetical protein
VKQLSKALIGALFLIVSAVYGGAAETHVITVGVDRPVFDDFKMLSDFIRSSSPGQPIPESLSKAGTAAMADIVALAERRADPYGWLSLDNAQQVHLDEGTVVQIATRVLDDPQTAGITLPVVIVRGQGYATVFGRADVIVPSGF